VRRCPILLLLCLAPAQEPTIRTRVALVVAPTTVTDRSGKFIDGLQASDFLVLDNGKPREIRMDTSDVALTPVSLVVAIQANKPASAALAKLRKTGSMIDHLITGDRGETAVVRFSDEIKLLQDFTRDSNLIVKAFRSLKTSGEDARSIDAAQQAVEMLAARPENRRRIVLLISESRDRGSRAELQAVLQAAQRANVTIYPLTFSVHATPWTARPADAPPAGGGLNILGVVRELARLGKTNTAGELARFTGGRRLSFVTLRALESELSRIGEELHSQYLISFSPAADTGEFHLLDVKVRGRPDLVVNTRPGYWN
jgi:VWFA-related protein